MKGKDHDDRLEAGYSKNRSQAWWRYGRASLARCLRRLALTMRSSPACPPSSRALPVVRVAGRAGMPPLQSRHRMIARGMGRGGRGGGFCIFCPRSLSQIQQFPHLVSQLTSRSEPHLQLPTRLARPVCSLPQRKGASQRPLGQQMKLMATGQGLNEAAVPSVLFGRRWCRKLQTKQLQEDSRPF